MEPIFVPLDNLLLTIFTIVGRLLTNINPLTAKLFSCNFHPPEVVSHWRDPELQLSKII